MPHLKTARCARRAATLPTPHPPPPPLPMHLPRSQFPSPVGPPLTTRVRSPTLLMRSCSRSFSARHSCSLSRPSAGSSSSSSSSSRTSSSGGSTVPWMGDAAGCGAAAGTAAGAGAAPAGPGAVVAAEGPPAAAAAAAAAWERRRLPGCELTSSCSSAAAAQGSTVPLSWPRMLFTSLRSSLKCVCSPLHTGKQVQGQHLLGGWRHTNASNLCPCKPMLRHPPELLVMPLHLDA